MKYFVDKAYITNPCTMKPSGRWSARRRDRS